MRRRIGRAISATEILVESSCAYGDLFFYCDDIHFYEIRLMVVAGHQGYVSVVSSCELGQWSIRVYQHVLAVFSGLVPHWRVGGHHLLLSKKILSMGDVYFDHKFFDYSK